MYMQQHTPLVSHISINRHPHTSIAFKRALAKTTHADLMRNNAVLT
jgi:hypothetical protein